MSPERDAQPVKTDTAARRQIVRMRPLAPWLRETRVTNVVSSQPACGCVFVVADRSRQVKGPADGRRQTADGTITLAIAHCT